MVSTDRSGLFYTRATLAAPDDHVVLPEVITEENLGPYVRVADVQWQNVVKWVIHATVAAEKLKLGQATVDGQINSVIAPEARALLGVDGEIHTRLGLSSDWAYQVIRQVGNYGEIYERAFGANAPIPIDRAVNNLVLLGGAMGAPAFR